MTPQIIYLVLALLALLFNAHMHGKPKTGEHNFFIYLISFIIGLCILCVGGFFNVFFK